MTERRAVVTGLGAVSPVGIGADATWDALVAGRSGIDRLTLFDPEKYGFEVDVAGEVKDFDATEFMDPKDVRRHDRATHFAVAATGEALGHAGLLGDDRRVTAEVNADRFGMVLGTGIGGIGMLLENHRILLERGVRRVSPFLIPHMIPDSASGQVAITYGLRGHNMAVVSACATGGHAIGEATEAIVRGQADIMLGGGTEAPLVPLAFAGFSQMRAPRDPARPGHRRVRAGAWRRGPSTPPATASSSPRARAVLVLEELEHALARGARPIAEVIGYGSSADAFDMAAPSERGEGNQRAMRAALDRARIEPEEVDYINPHGTSTPLNDRYETMAIRAVFGDHADQLAVSSTKSMTGHAMGAAGAIEALVCAKVIETGCIPPTINYRHPDPELTLDYVPNEARAADVRVALSNSMGLGGHNSSVILRRFEG